MEIVGLGDPDPRGDVGLGDTEPGGGVEEVPGVAALARVRGLLVWRPWLLQDLAGTLAR